jgi:hypothetical protein
MYIALHTQKLIYFPLQGHTKEEVEEGYSKQHREESCGGLAIPDVVPIQ